MGMWIEAVDGAVHRLLALHDVNGTRLQNDLHHERLPASKQSNRNLVSRFMTAHQFCELITIHQILPLNSISTSNLRSSAVAAAESFCT